MYVKLIEYLILYEVYEIWVDCLEIVIEVDLCDFEIYFEFNINEKKNIKE